jgi:serine/threonine protein kinase
MEKMQGDLRTLINVNMEHLDDGCMPLGYNETVAMMLEVAQGMEDLHGCGLIHADLKASNILVCPKQDVEGGKVDKGDEKKNELHFQVKIADFDTSDGIWGTGFWRAPEVLQAQLRGARTPLLSPAADVYSYGMLCYELLTGKIPFDKICGRSDYNVVISGRRPQLPAHLNLRMKELLSGCWRANPQDRPGWTWIIEILKKEQKIYPLLSIDDSKIMDIISADSPGPDFQLVLELLFCNQRFYSSWNRMVKMQLERYLEMQRIKDDDDDDSHIDDVDSHEADDDDDILQPLGLQF